jgi:hypothetical protein
MAVVVSLPLFASPDRELEDKTKVAGTDLRKLATEVHERLQKAAEILDQLRAAGWSAQVASYDLMLSHPAVRTREDATGRLQQIGIDSEKFLIFEEPDDEE